MKRIIALLTLLGLVGSASAATIAHWRFEEGTPGVQSTLTYSNFYADISGNANHLSAATASANPTATADVPFSTGNAVALDFEADNSQFIGTWGPGDIHDKALDSFSFVNGWTIEASFKIEDWKWGGVVGKDGQPDLGRGEQNLVFKVRDDNHMLECGFYDNNTNWYDLATFESLELGQWYSATLTYDNNSTRLYLKKEGIDPDYVLQATEAVPAGAALDLEEQFWVVGRGMWGSGTAGDIFDGMIDEVKISDLAIAPPGATIPFEVEKPYNVATSGFRTWSSSFGLSASAFLSPVGYTHTASQWQISSSTDFTTPEWDSGVIAPAASVTIPANTLPAGTYYARVSYQGDTEWSQWSDTTLLQFIGIDTIAYWRFETSTFAPQPVDGAEHAGNQDDWYEDISGNGNHMSSWWEESRPMATSDIPFTGIPGIGANTLAVDFDNGTGGTEGADDLGTFGNGGGKMIESYSFTNGWTMECSFKARDLDHWQVAFGKDGWRGGIPEEPESPFSFKLAPSAETFGIRCLILRDDNNFDFIDTAEIVVDKWYTVVATYDNVDFKVYLKSEDDADFSLEGTLNRTEGIALGSLNSGTWTIGRGMWGGNPADFFNGQVDEVRVSNGALFPSEFIHELDPIPPIGDIAMVPVAGGFDLTWTTGSDYNYVLLEKTTLTAPTWSTNQAGIPGGESNVTVTVTADEAAAFFGVVSE